MDIGHLLRQLRGRVDVMVSRAVIALVNDALKTQRVQLKILAGEVTDDKVEHFQPYGLSFVPPVGSEAVALAVGGSRGHTIAVCAQHPDHRPAGANATEGGLYSRGEWRVFVDEDGVVHIGAKSGASDIARADKVDAEIKRIWDTLADASIVPAPAAPPDAGEPGLTAFLTAVGTASALVESVAASKGKVT